MNPQPNLVWHSVTVSRSGRETHNGHRSVLVWFAGLSGAGKSTLAHAVEERLHQKGCATFVFGGDNVRHGLCADLGFWLKDRFESIRRVGEMAKLFLEAGVIALTAFISPTRADRRIVRSRVAPEDSIDVYVRCPLDVCEVRDVKGMYKRARAGEIPEFTGITSPYEEPEAPERVIDTHLLTVDEAVDRILALIEARSRLDAQTTEFAQ